MSGGGLGADIAQRKWKKRVGPPAPHIFLTFVAQSRPPDPLRTRFLRELNICDHPQCTLCYAIVPPGRKAAFRAGFWPDCYRERTEIGSPAGRRAEFCVFPVAVRPKSNPEGRFPTRNLGMDYYKEGRRGGELSCGAATGDQNHTGTAAVTTTRCTIHLRSKTLPGPWDDRF